MSKKIFDLNALSQMADAFCNQAGVLVGIYDDEGSQVYLNPGASFSDPEVKSCISRLGAMGVENVIDSPVPAVAMRNEDGELVGLWLVRASTELAPEEFDKSLSLLEVVLSAYIKERVIARSMSEKVGDFERAGEDMSKELRQNEVITEILSKVESEEDFERVVQDILVLTGEYLGLSHAFILQMDPEESTASLLSQWRGNDTQSMTGHFSDIAISDLPFADGLSYTISSDSRMPDYFKIFMRDCDISAGVFLPIFLNDVNVMYLCATMERVPRHWRLSEAGFLNDVKRVITTILSKRITKNSLASSYAVVENVLENTGCGIIVFDNEEGNVLYTNERFKTMFSDLSDRQKFERKIKQTPDKMTHIRELYVENAQMYVSVDFSMIQWVDDAVVRLCTIFDITSSKEFEIQIEKNANIDELTGIYNRVYFKKELSELLSAPHPAGALICMNIDGFKDVNLAVGSEAGDSILASVAKFLLKMSSEYVRVYRLGADEFAIVVRDCEKAEPRIIAENVIRRFDMPWQLAYTDCFLTVSVGVAFFPEDGDDIYTIENSAGIALSEARRRAGCIEYYTVEMDRNERQRISEKAVMKNMITTGFDSLSVYKIPYGYVFGKDDLKSGFMSLMEWNIEDVGKRDIYEILEVARKAQMDVEVLRHYINESVGALRDQNDFGYPEHYMGILVRTSDLVRANISGIIKDAIKRYSAQAEKLVVCMVGGREFDVEALFNKACRDIRSQGVNLCMLDPASFALGDQAVYGQRVDFGEQNI